MPKIEYGEFKVKSRAITTNKMSDAGCQRDILRDNEGRQTGSKQEHTKLAASDYFNNPGLQNGGGIDVVESLNM